MGWAEAIKAAIIAIPKLVDAFRDVVTRLDGVVEAMRNAKLQEIRNEQRMLERQILQVVNDQDRRELTRRLSDLERRL